MLRVLTRATAGARLHGACGSGVRALSTGGSGAYSAAEEDVFVDEVDVLIVGGGPAGLSAAIRAKQAFEAAGQSERRVCVLEKGAELGAHILSGNVLEPRALDELLPEWRESEDVPLVTPAKDDSFVWLTSETSSIKSPIVPPQMHNDGNYIISLSKLVRWLGEQAEALGVEAYPGYAGAKVLFHDDGSVKGVATNDVGIAKDGSKKDDFMPGMELHAPVTLFAEGCRGSLTQWLFDHYGLTEGTEPQSYAIGLKEVWEVPDAVHSAGTIQHTVGWPMDMETYGGSFLYHLEDNRVAVGFVIALDYKNPYLNPYREFQRFKHHPEIAKHLEGGTCIAYGARALNEGGYQSIPKLNFPGGALVGCAAGFLNVPKVKGTHTAMQSGIYAADTAVAQVLAADGEDASEVLATGSGLDMQAYEDTLKSSWVYDELKTVRNIRPGFKWGFLGGLVNAAFETATMGFAPWTLTLGHADHEARASLDSPSAKEIDYPKPDGVLSFDLLTNLQRSNTNHEEDQPAHLQLRNDDVPVDVNLAKYGGPEARFCPAGVYEFLDNDDGSKRLQINAQNCLHCKTCSIADATQNIRWVVPEGGGGPLYSEM